jgi:hypothetical protein
MELGLFNRNSILTPFTVERRSTLILGKPQTGKSTALSRLALDDIHNGLPVVYISDSVENVLNHIPKSRQKDTILFEPSSFPFAFNILSSIPPNRHALFASTFLKTVKGVWGYENVATPVLDQYIRAGIQSLLQVPSTLVSLKFLLTDKNFRKDIQGQLTDPILKDFWDDYETLTDKEKRQDTSSTLNKIRSFLFEPNVRNCLDQKTNKLSFNGIVLVSLKDELGENACLIGALVLCLLYVHVLEGVETNLYIDGAHKYGPIDHLISRIHTVFTLQFLDQVKNPAPLIGSVGQILAFRSSVRDSDFLEPEFNLTNDHFPLFALKPYRAMVAIDGIPTELHMLPHFYKKTDGEKIRKRSQTLSQPLHIIEKRLERHV